MNFSRQKKPKIADARQVFDYACWLLARRNYSQKELLEKFNTRFIPNEEVFIAALEKLQKLRLQSDENFTGAFIRSHPGWGRRRLIIELKRRGIEEEMIEDSLPSEDSEVDRAREALGRKLKGEKVPEDFKERQKLSAFLARRGFDLDVIRELVRF